MMAEAEQRRSSRLGWVQPSSHSLAGNGRGSEEASSFSAPHISLPKGGGAIRGIGEKFHANPATGTANITIPLAISPGRSGFGPQLALTYDSGAGNGPFGMGWRLSLPSITRKTDKGLPRYQDSSESDVFILSGTEDLVPMLRPEGARRWVPDERERDGYLVKRYRPRVEGLFARIERWTHLDSGETHWRSLSRDNVLTVYGLDHASRVADPEDPSHVFSWLICQSYDDQGNAVVYDYLPENAEGVDPGLPGERNRVRSANRYLKRVRYGNRRPLLLDVEARSFRRNHLSERTLDGSGWMFAVVFDYGDEDYREVPSEGRGQSFVDFSPASQHPWPARLDPFSAYRSGFEVRTYRLCRRVLMLHRIPEELGADPYLVRSTNFAYHEKPIGTLLTSASTSGYRRLEASRYLKQSTPALEFTYTPSPLEQPPHEAYELVELATPTAHLPAGIDGTQYRWLDLDGVGIASVLSEQADAWFYSPNLGDGRFGPTEVVPSRPSLSSLNTRRQELLDLGGDGNLDLVELGAPTPGFQERRIDASWGPFRAFSYLPVRDWTDGNLRFVDVTGDGLADVLISRDDGFTWHPSLRYEGFGDPITVPFASDEQQGPRVMFDDGTQSIYLADMSGDGLADIVRIRQGEVCYWPNRGYGHFGAKITMGNAPWFDDPDLFDQKRIRLADTDGSGPTDLVYLGRDGARIYLNEAGNRWSDARELPQFPLTDELASVSVVDFLGRGTACLLWSSSLPSSTPRPLRYVDLMRGRKPHLLTRMRNNLGAETVIDYGTSTEFYLADQAEGRPWIVRLPFPVHVVTRVETYDFIGRNRFVTRYRYHHGYYDGPEREFRGFGLVEQLDGEELSSLAESGAFPAGRNEDRAAELPPVLSKTWFHVGAYLENGRVSRQYEHEYYHEPGPNPDQQRTMELDDTVLPEHLTPEEAREACRALKGSMLRQEVYALDGKEESARPYTVTETNFTVRLLQPRDDNRHAVFLSHPRESIALSYDRKLYKVGTTRRADPRASHSLTLAVDDYGNVLRSVSIGYGRRLPDRSSALSDRDHAVQQRTLLTLTENVYTHAVQQPDAYRTPLLAETSTYELTGLDPQRNEPSLTSLFRFDEMQRQVERLSDGAHDLPYQEMGTGPGIYRRLISRSRTRYRSNRLDRLLPLGALEALALPGESHALAFTPGLLAEVYRRPLREGSPEDLLPRPGDMLREGGYVDVEGDGRWWIPSGHVFYAPSNAGDPAQELRQAARHFFLARRFQDPFGNESTVRYDAYGLYPVELRDPVGNAVCAEHDYRVLAPRLLTDPNGNRSEVAFDTLGMVVGTAVMGKEGEHEGDSLHAFVADLPEEITLTHLRHPLDDPHAILQGATTRLVYDLFAFQRTASEPQPEPAGVHTLQRETHRSDLAAGEQTKIQHLFAYSDGFGREIQQKSQAPPGPASGGGPPPHPSWIGSGWTIFNNKSNPVRRYEPFFTGTHRFEFATIVGVSSTLFYDPVQRLVATLHPNHTYEKVIFDPWREESWDVNDTLLEADPAADPEVGDFFQRLPTSDVLPTWYEQRAAGALGHDEAAAAAKTAVHARTPARSYVDSLGRSFLTVVHNRWHSGQNEAAEEAYYATRIELDIQGNQRSVTDALDRRIMTYDYDLRSRRIHQCSADAGERWMLSDIAGKPLYAWDSRGFRQHHQYDALRRPAGLLVRHKAGHERLAERLEYGESLPDAPARNLRDRLARQFDAAGIATNLAFDFKGNLLHSSRRLLVDYRGQVDWARSLSLEKEEFAAGTTYDALNRVVASTAPDGSVIRPTFNQMNLLQRVDVDLRGSSQSTPFVSQIDYNAKGQREFIAYGNGVRTRYAYDPLTFRVTRLGTNRSGDGAVLQDLRYTYDPIGNISGIQDQAQETIYFDNQVVPASTRYVYDAIYRLIEADGREHVGQHGESPTYDDDAPRQSQPLPGDGHAMQRYRERYVYDPVGNILTLGHAAARGGWTRCYAYGDAPLQPANNRLNATEVGSIRETYDYDAHGNMTRMPHLPVMEWDFKDQLAMTQCQAVNEGPAERTYYVYDASGQRVRKVTERAHGGKRHERIYLGGFELYRAYGGDGEVSLERETLHVMDDRQRLALVETVTADADAAAAALPCTTIRYQLANHLGSSVLELDGSAKIISYEEYYPYGSTSYQAGPNAAEVSLKRYRFTGKERDNESGLYYHGARYYAPWLGRWTSCDPIGTRRATNLYLYCGDNPTNRTDPSGSDWEFTWKPWEWEPIAFTKEEIVPRVEHAAHRVVNSGPVQFALGIADAQVDLAKGFVSSLVDPVGTIRRIGHAMKQAYNEEGGGLSGVLMAVNQINPAYQAMVAVYETDQAVKSGDYRKAGAQAYNAVVGVVGTVGAGFGGAGLATKALGVSSAADAMVAADTSAAVTTDAATDAAAAPKPPAPPADASAVSSGGEISQNATSTPTENAAAGVSDKPDVYVGALKRWKVTAGAKSRGITATIRQEVVDWAKRHGTMDGPPTEGPVHAGHQYGGSHVFTPPGETTQVGAQTAYGNLSQAADEARAAASRRAWNAAHPQGPHLPVRPLGSK